MYDSKKEKWEKETGDIALEEQIGEGKATHDRASNGIASFPADSISQRRDPGTNQDRGEGKGPHQNAYIRLGPAMILNEKGEEEECAQTADGKKIGSGHEEKCAAIEHGKPFQDI
jgi:hypothetical protein